jgi:uncharacterized protein (TIGR02145 family)
MKKFLASVAIVLIEVSLFAQSPQKMSYQAVIRNSSSGLVTNHIVGMRISILQGSTSGTPVYVETQTPTTNENGLVSIEIGGGSIVSGTFGAIDWSTGTYFIKSEIDPTGATNYSIAGANQILSVPYSLYSKTAETSSDAVKTTGDQSIAGNKTFTGVISASSQNITNVANPLNVQDAATKAYVDAIQSQITMLKNTLKAGGIVTDYDGNVYNTVVIGTQTWMAENLKVTHFNDGTRISLNVANPFYNSDSSLYCWLNNDLGNKDIYGALYNWTCALNNKLCPVGWHVPSDTEWNTLESFLGINVAGDKLKEFGTIHWSSPNTGATNETGFTALPGGMRVGGTPYLFYSSPGSVGYWWGTTHWVFTLGYNSDGSIVNMAEAYMDFEGAIGLSVRCLKN